MKRKTIIITGTSSGNSKVTAELFAAKGWYVAAGTTGGSQRRSYRLFKKGG